MRKGQKAGETHSREDLADHFEIKPRANEPKPKPPNDAHRRLQLTPSDPRWELRPPYGWVETKPGQALSHGLTVNKCWYCAEFVSMSEVFLYSKRLSMPAHPECYASGDTIATNRATPHPTK